jgi:hypothetical protein
LGRYRGDEQGVRALVCGRVVPGIKNSNNKAEERGRRLSESRLLKSAVLVEIDTVDRIVAVLGIASS